VALGLAVEPEIEAVEHARDRVATLVSFNLRICPVCREHRVERERDEKRYENRACNGEGERLEPLPCYSVHECDGHEHRDDREGRGRDRETDLVGTLVRGCHVILTHL